MPELTGRRAIVTGANSGLGYVTAADLAAHGAIVTMAVRDLTKGHAAAAAIQAANPAAQIHVAHLDLADLSSVRQFAEAWSAEHPDGLDLLINNAGIMAIPRKESVDGFEMQLATNHLGHFALTGLLLPALIAVPRSRVVTVSSQAHRMGSMKFDDLQSRQSYGAWRAYGQSKLANLLFVDEFQRRLDRLGIPMLSLGAHPGFASTNLQKAGPAMRGRKFQERFAGFMTNLMAQSAEMGALPTLFAATAPGIPGGSYIGPDGFGEQRGHPRIVNRSSAAKNESDAKRLWDESEVLTGVTFPIR